MHLNKLKDVKKVKLGHFKLSAVGQEYVSSDEDAESEAETSAQAEAEAEAEAAAAAARAGEAEGEGEGEGDREGSGPKASASASASASAAEGKKTKKGQEIVAFDIDSKAQDGRVVLLYRDSTRSKPQIWFQDLSCCWFFIANTFTDYFRLMIMHLGLPHWYDRS
jgi:hypothetical protein